MSWLCRVKIDLFIQHSTTCSIYWLLFAHNCFSLFIKGPWTANFGAPTHLGTFVETACWGGEIESQGFKSHSTRKDEIETHEKETWHSWRIPWCWGKIIWICIFREINWFTLNHHYLDVQHRFSIEECHTRFPRFAARSGSVEQQQSDTELCLHLR